jgi:hypothetical protein
MKTLTVLMLVISLLTAQAQTNTNNVPKKDDGGATAFVVITSVSAGILLWKVWSSVSGGILVDVIIENSRDMCHWNEVEEYQCLATDAPTEHQYYFPSPGGGNIYFRAKVRKL